MSVHHAARGTVCSYVWCSILFFSDAACAGRIAGFDTLDTAGAESIALKCVVS